MSFQGDLMRLINKHGLENRYDIPDFVLAKYLCDCHAVLGENLVRLRIHEARKTSERGAVDNSTQQAQTKITPEDVDLAKSRMA